MAWHGDAITGRQPPLTTHPCDERRHGASFDSAGLWPFARADLASSNCYLSPLKDPWNAPAVLPL